jgi:hypothetical protein
LAVDSEASFESHDGGDLNVTVAAIGYVEGEAVRISGDEGPDDLRLRNQRQAEPVARLEGRRLLRDRRTGMQVGCRSLAILPETRRGRSEQKHAESHPGDHRPIDSFAPHPIDCLQA